MMWGYGPDWGYMGYGGWGWFGVLHMIIWLLILALLIAAIVWFARTMTQRSSETPQAAARRPPGLDILEERYARGEINRDEYLQKRRDILGDGI